MSAPSSSGSTQTTLPPSFKLTEKQLELRRLLSGPQRHTLVYGGARSGKTFLILRQILVRALRAPGSRHAMLRMRANAARASLWLDTLPKVHRLCFTNERFPNLRLIDHRSDGFVEVQPGGAELWIGGLDEKERVEKILGQEFATLYLNECSQIPYSSLLVVLTRLAQKVPGLLQRAYYDLNPVGSRHYTNIRFVQGRDPVSLQPTRYPEQYRYAYANPQDNAENLTPEMLEELDALPERQRKRFYEGVYQAEIDGALWTFELIEHARCTPEDVPEDLKRCVVAVDPSGTSGDENKRSDNVGIIVVALGMDDTAYVLADLTCNLAPEAWARRVVAAYRQYGADRIVAEQNFGGDIVRALLHTADPNVPVVLVNASRGKAVRAEPVSALYGYERDGVWHKDQVRHVGQFPELEDEMLNFSTAGYLGDRSPDRADALVWGLTDLRVAQMKGEGFYENMRRRAAEAGEANRKPEKPAPPPAPGSAEWQALQARTTGPHSD
jgi:terminase large subunit-like protein